MSPLAPTRTSTSVAVTARATTSTEHATIDSTSARDHRDGGACCAASVLPRLSRTMVLERARPVAPPPPDRRRLVPEGSTVTTPLIRVRSSGSAAVASAQSSMATSIGVWASPSSVSTACSSRISSSTECCREFGFFDIERSSTEMSRGGTSARSIGCGRPLVMREISSADVFSLPGTSNGERPASSE